MDSVLRGGAIYLALLVIFRLSGRRTLSEITTFDFVLLLITGEATQQALLGDDFSITNALLVILTLLVLDVGTSRLEARWPRVGRWVSGVPIVVVENGRAIAEVMHKARLSEEDILEAARASQGLERLDQIKFAVMERNGSISIVPIDGK